MTLDAGDVLYFPAGVFHEVESLDDDNISLNISLMAPTTAEVICSALRHRLLRTDAGRARVTSDAAGLAKLEDAVRRRQGAHGHSARRGSHRGDDLPARAHRAPRRPSPAATTTMMTMTATISRRLTSRTRCPGWRATAQTADATLSVNQLYSLTTPEQLGVPISRADEIVWVLVCGNYAGNDELEPAVRVRLVMDRTNYSHLKKAMASGDWAALAPALRRYCFTSATSTCRPSIRMRSASSVF